MAWEHYSGIRALNPPILWGLVHAKFQWYLYGKAQEKDR
jgi:hypothetical protein